MKDKAAEYLWDKYLRGDCNAEEAAKIESWYNQAFNDAAEVEVPDYNQLKHEIWQQIIIAKPVERTKRSSLWLRVAAAASVFVAVGIGLYFYTLKNERTKTLPGLYANDIKPGSDKAFLTLANGKRISLTGASSGLLANQSGLRVTRKSSGELVFQAVEQAGVPVVTGNNVIETPRGGQCQIVLPDGSRVWLNASSSLSFPVSFIKADKRKIVLEGQGYFEVVKDKTKPFIVQSRNQNVEVLGTHFDVNAYADEPSIKTTLLEGSVRVSRLTTQSGTAAFSSQVLKPNEQSILSDNGISVISVESDDVIAWKNGKFMFNNEELESIMKKVSRWYNVDVKFTDEKMKKNAYWGTVSRFENVSKVLKTLELIGDVHFKIEQQTIIVMP